MKAKPNNPFLGRWRILEMEVWDRDYIDEIVPGYFEFKADGLGSFQFGTVGGGLDCRLVEGEEKSRIEFSWFGQCDNDVGSGRGWAELSGGELHGRIFIHLGDDSSFKARKSSSK